MFATNVPVLLCYKPHSRTPNISRNTYEEMYHSDTKCYFTFEKQIVYDMVKLLSGYYSEVLAFVFMGVNHCLFLTLILLCACVL